MGFLDKFVKKRERTQEEAALSGEPESDHSAGPESEEPSMPERHGQYTGEIHAHFAALFPGRNTYVFQDPVPGSARLHVNIMEPMGEEPYYVLYTTGMSDCPMTLPEELSEHAELSYAELFCFLPPDWDPGEPEQSVEELPEQQYWPVRLLKRLSAFPQRQNTWLACGHAVPNGAEFAPFCADTGLCGAVLTQLAGELGGFAAADGTRINLLMPIPAYREEIEFVMRYGMEELDKRYEEGRLPMVVDLNRRNFCA